MPHEEDIVEIGGVRMNRRESDGDPKGPRSRFLSVWYRCCHTYGRLYRNREQTMYVGRCPRCGAQVHALIGQQGTSRRMFEAR
jgi:hypothetical protein